MAVRLSPYFNSSSTTFSSPSSFTDERMPTTKLFRIRVCMKKSRRDQNKRFELKALHLQLFNDVSLQVGAAADTLVTEAGQISAKDAHTSFPITKKTDPALSIVVVGASGNLARKKIFPALFALYYEDRLPENFTVFGYSRSVMTDEEVRKMISQTLTCRVDNRETCNEKVEQFLKRCFYHSGRYSSEEHFLKLENKLQEAESGRQSNRLFYLALPPDMFVDVARCIRRRCSSDKGWTRVIVEKPFGHDTDSSRELTRGLKEYLTEGQIFRIDHHLGEELVENLLVLRFSNIVFEPLWSRNYIRNVQVIFSEDFGIDGQGRFFDNCGIIRDVMQNHLLQVLALFAMETPISLDAEDIINEKVKVLRSMRAARLEDVVLGQYKGYCEGGELSVSKNSLTPTFAAATFFINNDRWDGVPFLTVAGKALQSKRVEIRVQFKNVPGNLFNRKFGKKLDEATNELVIRVQPDEAIYLKINNKVPGLGMRLDQTDINLLHKARCGREVQNAYEMMILDAIEGRKRLFMRSDEVDAAWSVLTPLLKEVEKKRVVPELYSCGSRGPIGLHHLAAKHNVYWKDFEYI